MLVNEKKFFTPKNLVITKRSLKIIDNNTLGRVWLQRIHAGLLLFFTANHDMLYKMQYKSITYASSMLYA
jgi:hypothetical protein